MNKELKKIYEDDQADRLSPEARGSSDMSNKHFREYVVPRDMERQNRVFEILKDDSDFDAEDYYNAAMILQHSEDKQSEAVPLAKKSMELGFERAKWLYAASYDRMLVANGKKQKFGTQFWHPNDGEITPRPVDEETTDEERAKYNVPPIEEALKALKEFEEK